jgi:sulfur-carrier protein
MTVTVHVPGALRVYCGGARELTLSAPSVGDALIELERRHPSLYRSVCDETGAVRRHVNVFVNSANVRDLQGLGTPLVPGDIVTILPAVSGG